MLQILDLFQKEKNLRFSELEKRILGLSPTTLTKRLRDLQKYGIVDKREYRETPPRVEYALTSSGKALGEMFSSLAKWNKRNF